MKDLLEIIGMGLIIVFIFFVILLPIIVIGYMADNYACTQFGQQVNNTVVYRVPTGCYVQIDNQWVPKDSYWQYIRFEGAK